MNAYRATRIEIDLNRIRRNVEAICSLVRPAQVMAVVKADGYGHGLVPIAETAIQGGASALAVAIPEEGEELRRAGITVPVLVLGGTNAAGAAASIRNELIQTVFTPESVREMDEEACKQGKTAHVHLKLDTGMGRIGCRTEAEVRAVLDAIRKAQNVSLDGAFSHFSDADADVDAYTAFQMERFELLTKLLPEGLCRHISASSALLRHPECRLQMVRAGIVLYGYPQVETSLDVRPAYTWKTEITYLKRIEAGDAVSYGRTFIADREMRVATLPVGYGDGYLRILSGKACVLIGGKRCPILGRVCMDQMMVDVSHVPDAKIGDEAVLIGRQGTEEIDAEELAKLAGTICYEILLSPSKRVPRVYINDPVKGNQHAEE